MNKVVIKILQVSLVTKHATWANYISLTIANFLHCICAKKYGRWLAVDKAIAIIINSLLFWATVL